MGGVIGVAVAVLIVTFIVMVTVGMAAALGVIKIPLFIRLQSHCKLVKMFSDLMVTIEILDVVGLDETRVAAAVSNAANTSSVPDDGKLS